MATTGLSICYRSLHNGFGSQPGLGRSLRCAPHDGVSGSRALRVLLYGGLGSSLRVGHFMVAHLSLRLTYSSMRAQRIGRSRSALCFSGGTSLGWSRATRLWLSRIARMPPSTLSLDLVSLSGTKWTLSRSWLSLVSYSTVALGWASCIFCSDGLAVTEFDPAYVRDSRLSLVVSSPNLI